MKDDKLYLIHISESIDKIEEYVVGLDFIGFSDKSIVQDAVLRKLQVLAESTQRLSDDFKSRHLDDDINKLSWFDIRLLMIIGFLLDWRNLNLH